MAKKEKASKKEEGKKPKKGNKENKEKATPGKAKYTYPKDCVSKSDQKKYRALMRQGKTWEGPSKAAAGKKSKKDPGNPKSVHLDGKGKVTKVTDNEGAKAEKKKKKKSED